MAATKAGRVDIHGIAAVNAVLAKIAKEDLNPARKALRDGSKRIANDTVIPALKIAANASGVPIAPRMADTMRAASDRVVFVRVGGVNPRLSGFRRRSKSSKPYRTTLAWGSELGPYPGAKVNHYDATRSRSHWAAKGAGSPATWAKAKREYQDLLDRVLREYGRPR